VNLEWLGPISNFALVGVLIYVETSFPDLGILDNPILTAIVLVAVFGILITWISTHFAATIPKFKNRRFVNIYSLRWLFWIQNYRSAKSKHKMKTTNKKQEFSEKQLHDSID
jgi:formate hydrogenlyase subunit 4